MELAKTLSKAAVAWRPTTAPMNARDLARDDDFLSHLLVENLGTEAPLAVHKMDGARRLPKHDPKEVLAIVQKHVVPKGGNSAPFSRVRDAVDALLRLKAVRQYIKYKSQNQVNAFATHASRYLELYLPTGSIEIAPTSRYTWKTGKSELCIIATVPLRVGMIITDLKGSLADLSPEQDEELKRTDRRATDGGIRRDFSVIYSKQKNVSHLFLGPARFVNHDCEQNCELFRDGRYITFKVVRPIGVGEEVTAHYGDEYFGKNNRRCMCATCEKRGLGRYAFQGETDPDDVTTSESGSSSGDEEPANTVSRTPSGITSMKSRAPSTLTSLRDSRIPPGHQESMSRRLTRAKAESIGKLTPSAIAANGNSQLITPPPSEEEVSLAGSVASRSTSVTRQESTKRHTRASLAQAQQLNTQSTPTGQEARSNPTSTPRRSSRMATAASSPALADADGGKDGASGPSYGLRSRRARESISVAHLPNPVPPKSSSKSPKRLKPTKLCSDCHVITLEPEGTRCSRCIRHHMVYKAVWPSRLCTTMNLSDPRISRHVPKELPRQSSTRVEAAEPPPRPLKRQKLSHPSTTHQDSRAQRAFARNKMKLRERRIAKLPRKKSLVQDSDSDSDSDECSTARPSGRLNGRGVLRDKVSRTKVGASRRQSAPERIQIRKALTRISHVGTKSTLAHTGFSPAKIRMPFIGFHPNPTFFARKRFFNRRASIEGQSPPIFEETMESDPHDLDWRQTKTSSSTTPQRDVVDLTMSDSEPECLSTSNPPEEFTFVPPTDQSEDELPDDRDHFRLGWGLLQRKVGPSYFAQRKYITSSPEPPSPPSTFAVTPPPLDDVRSEGSIRDPSEAPRDSDLSTLSSHQPEPTERDKQGTTMFSWQTRSKSGQFSKEIASEAMGAGTNMVLDFQDAAMKAFSSSESEPPKTTQGTTHTPNTFLHHHGLPQSIYTKRFDPIDVVMDTCDSTVDTGNDGTLRELTPTREKLSHSASVPCGSFDLRSANFEGGMADGAGGEKEAARSDGESEVSVGPWSVLRTRASYEDEDEDAEDLTLDQSGHAFEKRVTSLVAIEDYLSNHQASHSTIASWNNPNQIPSIAGIPANFNELDLSKDAEVVQEHDAFDRHGKTPEASVQRFIKEGTNRSPTSTSYHTTKVGSHSVVEYAHGLQPPFSTTMLGPTDRPIPKCPLPPGKHEMGSLTSPVFSFKPWVEPSPPRSGSQRPMPASIRASCSADTPQLDWQIANPQTPILHLFSQPTHLRELQHLPHRVTRFYEPPRQTPEFHVSTRFSTPYTLNQCHGRNASQLNAEAKGEGGER